MNHIKEVMLGAAVEAGATIVGQSFHKFDPRGVTGIIAIAESHLCIHTWPEYGYAAVDIFTCGTAFTPRKAAELIVQRLHCEQPSLTEIMRGPLVGAAVPTV
jgi:S-adenosylmethionine decarboxylase